ncbi:MAG: hypothetical protein JOZ18_01770 [Chloroflexi bacterium]|nr:hypothetical protein [Chloroflexota bacterium]
MTWFDRLLNLPEYPQSVSRLQLQPEPQSRSGTRPSSAHIPEQRITEQINPTFFSSSPTQEDWYWGRIATGGEEDYLWRRLSDNWYQKDVIPSTYLEIHNQCYEAYNANPLAFAIIELTTSFVMGEGITVSAANKRVQQVLDAFWHDPENRMDERIYSLCTELSLYGEQFIHFFVNKYDGSVIIRQIDPSLIDQIETDPEDVEKPLRYHRRPIGQVMSATSGDPPHFDPGKPVDTQGQWFQAGKEVIHIAINKVSNARRGKSDLATLLPWLRRYKDWLTDRVRINKFKAAFLWDVSLSGADKKTIDRKKMEYAYPPEPGSVIIHNEAEKWSAVEPHIQANDASEDGRQIKLMVAVGAALPEHYLADGDNGNRATASEMSLPTLLKFKRRQRVVKYMLKCILDRVIAEAKRAGKLGARIDTSYEITFPEIDSGEHNTLAQALNWLVPALKTARAEGWISDETAMKIMFEYCGTEVDIHAEMAKIAASNRPGGGSR